MDGGVGEGQEDAVDQDAEHDELVEPGVLARPQRKHADPAAHAGPEGVGVREANQAAFALANLKTQASKSARTVADAIKRKISRSGASFGPL